MGKYRNLIGFFIFVGYFVGIPEALVLWIRADLVISVLLIGFSGLVVGPIIASVIWGRGASSYSNTHGKPFNPYGTSELDKERREQMRNHSGSGFI
ncbi:MAG: hypothetical protein KGI27_01740 [Thaumarchaeota archaeon]|nr:hypothetical protein [Nitrososphaerota archaeon]